MIWYIRRLCDSGNATSDPTQVLRTWATLQCDVNHPLVFEACTTWKCELINNTVCEGTKSAPEPLTSVGTMAKASTIKAIYKCLLADATALERTPQFRLRNALRLEQWGTGHYLPPRTGPSGDGEEPVRIRSLKSYLEMQERGFRYEDSFESITDMMRNSFKENMHEKNPQVVAEKLDEAITALQEVSNQLILAQCSSVTKTNGVRIEATSQYVPSHSSPEQNLFRYTYRITITNENADATVQITGRQYTFMSERGQRVALPRHSPGIVGNTPLLQPGQSFEYASGVDLDAPRGFVTGCLHSIRRGAYDFAADEETFDAFVSKFHLIAPGIKSVR